MRARLELRALPPLLLLAAAAGACRPATGIAVVVDVPAYRLNASEPDEVTQVVVDVAVEGRSMMTTSGRTFPMKFELVSDAPNDLAVEITARAVTVGADTAATQTVHTNFDPGRWRLLRFPLGCCPNRWDCPTIDAPASRLPPLTGDVPADDDPAAADLCVLDRPQPDETNTGPAQTPTTSCSPMIATEGAVVDGCDFAQCVTITANNVVLRNSRVRCDGPTAIQVGGVGATLTGVVVEDVEVDGSRSDGEQWGIGGDGVTVLRAKVHDVARGVLVGSGGLVQDSYIYRLTSASQHGVYAGDGAGMAVVHNRIQLDRVPGACVTFTTDNGAIDRVLIEGNTLDGGSNVIEVLGSPAPTQVAIYHNRFGTSQINGELNHTGAVDWQFNVRDATGAAIPLP